MKISSGNNETKIATRAIIIVGNTILLGKRSRGMGKDQFALVGGKPEAGEKLEQTVIREVFEEIGLKLINPVLWMDEINESWHVYYFYGNAEGGLNLKRDEISEVVYVNQNNLSEFNLAFNHEDVLKRFFKDKLSDY